MATMDITEWLSDSSQQKEKGLGITFSPNLLANPPLLENVPLTANE